MIEKSLINAQSWLSEAYDLKTKSVVEGLIETIEGGSK